MSAIMEFQKNIIKQFVDMGYDENIVREVLPQTGWNYETAFEVLANFEWDSTQSKIIAERQSQSAIKKQGMSSLQSSAFLNGYDEQAQIAQAMNASLFNQSDQPVEKRKRIKQVPIGLQNYGNTCYLSCLLQIFFYNPVLVKLILQYKASQINDQRGKSLIKFIEEIQKCFVRLILRNENYIKTKDIFEAIQQIDQNPQQLKRGDFKDANEYLEFILEFINRGLEQEFNKNIIIQGFSNKILDQQYQIKSDKQSHLQIFTRPQFKNIYQILYQYQEEFINEKFQQLPDNLIINVVRNSEQKDKNQEEIELKQQIGLDFLLEQKEGQSQISKSKVVGYQTQEQQQIKKQYDAFKKTIKYFEQQPICQDNVIVSLKTQFEQLELQLQELELEDQSILQNSQYKYYLAQIIIHVGSVASGHYYVYQYNFQLQQWIKYNDTMVVFRDQQVVMDDVAKNCNVIIYISEEQKNKVQSYQAQLLTIEEYLDIKSQISFEKNQKNIEFLNYIPQQIGKLVLDENQAFTKEYQRVVK